MQSRLVAVLLTSGVLVAPSVPAYAIEAAAAAQAFGDALVKGTGGKAAFASAVQDGDNIVIEGLAITSHDSSDTVTFAETVIESPTEDGDGVFTAPRVTMSDGVLSGESSGTIANAAMTNITVLEAQVEGAATTAPGIVFEAAEATDMAVGPADKPFKVNVDRVSVTMSNIVDGVPHASQGSVEGIVVPPEAFAESDFKPEMLGYDNLTFGVTWNGERDPAANMLTLTDATLSLEDGGSLTITGELGNLPDPSAIQSQQRRGAASELIVHSATLRYEDDSLAGKVLDMQAEKQGVSREEYAQQITGALPFLLAAINNPEFQNQVSGAIGAFLQDPQSLTVRIAPETPITGAEILGIVGSAPQTLPDRLNASVTSNSAE